MIMHSITIQKDGRQPRGEGRGTLARGSEETLDDDEDTLEKKKFQYKAISWPNIRMQAHDLNWT